VNPSLIGLNFPSDVSMSLTISFSPFVSSFIVSLFLFALEVSVFFEFDVAFQLLLVILSELS
jgi:hypothetical protein